jgi:hypothetical protein
MEMLYADVLQEILAHLSLTKDRVNFLLALGRGYRPWLDLEIQRVVNWMIIQGAAIGWVYKADFAPLIKAKRIAKKWTDSRYCQGCGRRSESSRWLHFVSTQTGKRLCTQCVQKEWETHKCPCGIPVSFASIPSSHDMFSPSIAWRAVCTPRKAWGAGCDFEQQITCGFFPSPRMRRQAEQRKRKALEMRRMGKEFREREKRKRVTPNPPNPPYLPFSFTFRRKKKAHNLV